MLKIDVIYTCVLWYITSYIIHYLRLTVLSYGFKMYVEVATLLSICPVPFQLILYNFISN